MHTVNNMSLHQGTILVNDMPFYQSTTEYVGRAFSPVVGIRTPPPPHPQASVLPHPLGRGGRAHSLAGEGLGESQFRRWDIHCGALYI
jgi:hypothetical protein